VAGFGAPRDTKAAAKRNRNAKLETRYDRATYYRAVRYGCEAAFKMPEDIRAKPGDAPAVKAAKSAKRSEWYRTNAFFPHQCRHRNATDLRREGGLEVAQIALGHSSRAMAEHYAEADVEKTKKIVERMG
jgi:integrase